METVAYSSCSVTYRAGALRAVAAGGDENLSVSVRRAGDVVEVVALPRVPLAVASCIVDFAHTFAPDERILMNGYQSWTDTVERSPLDRMRGLLGVPRAIVEKYALDGGGDYRFYDYELARGRLHGYTYATFRREGVGRPGSASVALVGSLDESDGFTCIESDTWARRVRVRKECPARELAAGEEVVLCRLAAVHAQTVDDAYGRWLELAGVRARPARRMIGYTSWYRHYDDISSEKLAHDLAAAVEAFGGLGLADVPARWEGCGPGDGDVSAAAPGALSAAGTAGRLGRLFQIDDGYAKVGDWLDVDAVKFPEGLAPLARDIEAGGFVPGLWVAPFVCERDSRLAAEHPGWLLRGKDGRTVPTGCQWSGGLALDTQVAEVRDYIRDVLRTMVAEWGFRLLKCDFLYAACMLPHGGLNRGQLMADGIDLIREAVGSGVALLACGVPLGSALGKVEYCRIGCDVGLDWDDKPYMRLLHRERVSTRASLANTRFRAPLDGRAFGNDPDVFFLRRDVRLTEARRAELLTEDARLGSVLLTSDDMGAWDEGDRAAYRAAVDALASKGTVPSD